MLHLFARFAVGAGPSGYAGPAQARLQVAAYCWPKCIAGFRPLFLLQELAETLGLVNLNKRLADPSCQVRQLGQPCAL